ncbi:MAG: large repetitive protein, partial [Actinomycetota bacterium]|nr:large repetitive protein [Actinomycetota bacterium]
TVATANAGATAGSDYTAVPLTTLTWTSTDALTKIVPATITGDVIKEGNEAFVLNLSAPTNAALADPSGQATIIDEEGRLFASIKDASVSEGNSGTKNLTFTVTLSAAPAAGQSATVDVATTDGTATAGSDYTAVAPTTTLTFSAGQSTKTVNVPIKGDTTVEPNETLMLTLSAPSANTIVADSGGLGAIVNDD